MNNKQKYVWPQRAVWCQTYSNYHICWNISSSVILMTYKDTFLMFSYNWLWLDSFGMKEISKTEVHEFNPFNNSPRISIVFSPLKIPKNQVIRSSPTEIYYVLNKPNINRPSTKWPTDRHWSTDQGLETLDVQCL